MCYFYNKKILKNHTIKNWGFLSTSVFYTYYYSIIGKTFTRKLQAHILSEKEEVESRNQVRDFR